MYLHYYFLVYWYIDVYLSYLIVKRLETLY